jgi:hypothetical protein
MVWPHHYPSGHTEADSHRRPVNLDGYRSPHKHGGGLGYFLARDNAQGVKAVGHTVAALNLNHGAALAIFELGQGYLIVVFRLKPASRPVHESVHIIPKSFPLSFTIASSNLALFSLPQGTW